MNPEDYSRDDLLTQTSPWLLGAGAFLFAAIWLILHLSRRKWPNAAPWGWLAGSAILAAAAFWCGFQLLGRLFSLATSWPLVAIAILGGFALSAIIWLYRFEKTLVTPGRGAFLLTLRIICLLLLLGILLQPVHSFIKDREINREIAILVDVSQSMELSDQRLDPVEIMDRAQLFEIKEAEGRPNLREVEKILLDLQETVRAEQEGIASAPSPTAGIQSRREQLATSLEHAISQNTRLTEVLDVARKSGFSGKPLPDEVRTRLDDYLRRSRDTLSRVLPKAREALDTDAADVVAAQLEIAREELEAIQQALPPTLVRSDEAFLESLSDDTRKSIMTGARIPRIELAGRILEKPVPSDDTDADTGQSKLIDRLKESYNLRLYRFARDIEEEPLTSLEEGGFKVPARSSGSEKSQTDLAGALEHILENSSPESLAGVLLLSDGRHNGSALPEDSLRQLAAQNSPLNAVPVGGKLGPVDISLLSLTAPESIYLDDRVVIKTEAKLDGLLGEKVTVQLLSGGEMVEEQVIEVGDVNYRTEIRFVHTPEAKGIHNYEVRIEPDPREIFQNNNSWDFKVAVTDDRTNVLLVDNYPRWEFRYLRNLFYGRDKSVHLQYVLLNPDQIDRANLARPIPASVRRKFGDAEATLLPATTDEWQLFDVIILGDIPPSSISVREWRAIEEAVTQRGTMLVCIAGPRFMPHGLDNPSLSKLLPIEYNRSEVVELASPEPAYRIQLTAAGRNHPVTSQSTSRSLNEERWAGFPPLRWRFASNGVKESAEVLAYAQRLGDGTTDPGGNSASPDSVEVAIERLANQKDLEEERALIVSMRAGLGKVLMMNFDRTWRFRYGVGDTYHHRFWGQVMRWGAGENLRSGNETVRLGTDRLSYTPSDPVHITAKVLDSERSPVTNADVYAAIYREDRRITRQKLSYRSNSSGIYETTVNNLPEEGEYRVVLEGDEVEDSLASQKDGPPSIETELLVVTTRNPVELAELTADRDFLNRATSMTGGTVAELWNLESLLQSFGAPKETLTERRNVTLWDKWPLLVAFLGLLTTEWIVRRRGGLV